MKKNFVVRLKTLATQLNRTTQKKSRKLMQKLFITVVFLLILAPVSFAAGASDDADKLAIPTLDNLKGQPIPDTDPPEYYPESAYKLTETQSAIKNTITKYLKNDDGTITPKYYLVTLKQTEYGDKENHNTADNKYFKWTTTNNKTTLTPGTESEHDITYYVNNTRTTALDRITTDQNGADVEMNFINLNITSSSNAYGGAIYNNSGTIGNIIGDFIGNYASSSSYYSAYGGAIYNNSGTIGNIIGDFIGNYASSSSSSSSAYGGAIYNNKTIGNITGDFISNYASSSSSSAYGGAIINYGTIGNITGDFIGNYASSSSYASGGAIYNYGTIGNITGDFIGNYASSSSAYGGAIINYGTIGNITGDFIGNYAFSSSYAYGGAIYNDGTIGNITGDFIGNYASSSSSSSSSAYGGAINNYGTIGNITGDFIGNYASSSSSSYSYSPVKGGAINNSGTIGNITGDFIGNYASSSSSSSSSYSPVNGGAINNYGTIGETDASGKVIGGISGSFINNYAKTELTTTLALGGAVWTNKDLNFIANDKQIEFSGNYTEDPTQGKVQNAIWVDTSSSTPVTITLKAQNDGSITLNDQIDGGKVSGTTIDRTKQYTLALTGDDTGKIILNNEIKNADITIDKTNVYVTDSSFIAPNKSLSVNSGVLNINNLTLNGLNYKTFTNAGTVNLTNVNVDLQKEEMGRISAETYGDTTGAINVQSLLLLSDATADKTTILFADKELANNVQYTGVNPVAYSPIYKYNVKYATNPEDNLGYFTFVRGGESSNPSDNYNPAILQTSVTQQAGAYTTQLQTFNYAFQHADTFMALPYLERMAIKNNNKYSLSPTGDATDVGVFSPLFTKSDDAGFWVKPYSSFENIPLNNGPKVSNINYGTLIGHDSALTPIKHGWDRVLTTYIAYNGASQRYQGVDSYQNGGILGGTVTLYKGNFFNATTLSVGASQGSNTGIYGSENYTMLLAGVGNKFGYNFELFKNKVIIQPSMLLSYSFVNTFDYNNAAGVRISSDPLNALQIAPGIKIIGNLENGWQPYIGVNMIWNILDNTRVQANDVRLPSMSIDPYVEYGVGIQKRWAQKYTAFAQAMIRNGGRNGISLTCGFRWAVGKK